jgi:hypothetical protein
VLADLHPALAQRKIEELRPASMTADVALFVLVQNPGDIANADDESFTEQVLDFLSRCVALCAPHCGKTSETEPIKVLPSVEAFSCFWFEQVTSGLFAAAEDIKNQFVGHALEMRSQLRIGIGRHGYAASRAALLVELGQIGVDPQVLENRSPKEQKAILKRGFAKATANLRASKKAFDEYIMQLEPQL